MVIDTNIIIAYLNGEPAVVDTLTDWVRHGKSLFISSTSYAELLSYPDIDERETRRIRELLKTFVLIELNRDIATHIGSIRTQRPSIKLPDAATAATALYVHTSLITRDKQLRTIPELNVLAI